MLGVGDKDTGSADANEQSMDLQSIKESDMTVSDCLLQSEESPFAAARIQYLRRQMPELLKT